MTTRLLDDEFAAQCNIFDENYARITDQMQNAAAHAGRDISEIRLLAATKTVPAEVMNHAVKSGVSLIGENRVQEYLSKYDKLEGSPERHFIGHLQTNKVKQIFDKVDLIESVDSVHLAKTIAALSTEENKTFGVLVEVNIGREKNKSGFYPEEIEDKISEISAMNGIFVRGLMAIPPVCEKNAQICVYFEQIYKLFIDISSKKIDNVSMQYLSMGMSGDFEQAITFGSNIVRIGSSLFGARNY